MWYGDWENGRNGIWWNDINEKSFQVDKTIHEPTCNVFSLLCSLQWACLEGTTSLSPLVETSQDLFEDLDALVSVSPGLWENLGRNWLCFFHDEGEEPFKNKNTRGPATDVIVKKHWASESLEPAKRNGFVSPTCRSKAQWLITNIQTFSDMFNLK